MVDGLLVLTALSVAAALACFRFVGCALIYDYGGYKAGEYGATVEKESSLVAYWRLGEKTAVAGDTAKDEKLGHDGEYQKTTLMAGGLDPLSPSTANPAILQAGKPGLLPGAPNQTSVFVDGGHVRVPFNADLALNPASDKQFSVEAWVLPQWAGDEMDRFRCVVVSRDEDAGMNRFGYILYAGPILDPTNPTNILDHTIHWQAWVGDGTPLWQMVTRSEVVDVSQATYLLLTYDGLKDGGTLTLDAMPLNSDGSAPRVTKGNTPYSPNTAQPLDIGMGAPNLQPPRYPFLGFLQEIAFYDVALSTEQAVAHFKAGKASGGG